MKQNYRGYDELVKKHINIVHETKQYQKHESIETNFFKCKAELNKLHVFLSEQGFDRCEYEVHESVVVVRRRNYETSQG